MKSQGKAFHAAINRIVMKRAEIMIESELGHSPDPGIEDSVDLMAKRGAFT
jgi:hypothetical protein